MRTTALRSRDRSVVLEQDRRGLLFETRFGSHRELAAHRQFSPTGSKDFASFGAGASPSSRRSRVAVDLAVTHAASKGGRPSGPSKDRRATRPFWILIRIQKSPGDLVALSELVEHRASRR